MIDHIGLEVVDLERSARFYDALMRPLGARRVHESSLAVAYGVHDARLWIVSRGRRPGPGFGHVALSAHGRAAVDGAHASALVAGGRDDGAPAARPDYGPRYYSGYLLDPDGLRIEVVSGSS